jgi:hypothetical protein
LDFEHMNSHASALDLIPEACAGTPLRCPRAMNAQTLTVATPVTMIGTLLAALLYIPRVAMLAPAAIRMTRRRA